MHDGVAETTCDEPPVDRERRDKREREREREASPEEEIAESRVHGPRHREHDEVVDDLHRCDRERLGRERNTRRSKERHPRTQERYEGEAVAEDVREDDPENDACGVPEAEQRRASEPEHLSDPAAGEAVDE